MKKIIITLLLLFPMLTQAQNIGIRSNLLGIATGSLNIEASVALTNKISLHLPFSWNPFVVGKNYKLNHLATMPGARYWNWHTYSGLFFGTNLIIAQYNVGITKYRYEGKGMGLSASCGYSFMLNRKLNLEVEIGAAAMYLNHDKYLREKCGDYESSFKGVQPILSKLSFSLIYII